MFFVIQKGVSEKKELLHNIFAMCGYQPFFSVFMITVFLLASSSRPICYLHSLFFSYIFFHLSLKHDPFLLSKVKVALPKMAAKQRNVFVAFQSLDVSMIKKEIDFQITIFSYNGSYATARYGVWRKGNLAVALDIFKLTFWVHFWNLKYY